jgi:hypothetical protein
VRRLVRRRVWLCRLLSLFFPGAHAFFSRRPVFGFLTLLLFFFLLASAVINSRLFGPGPLAPESAWTGFSLAALGAAALVWATSVWLSWRQPHGA